MEKIPTLYARGRDGRLLDQFSPEIPSMMESWTATEKLEGASVRVTVRSGTLVRLEVRCLPSKEQGKSGIVEPWYRDAHPQDQATSSDYWLWDAATNTNYDGVPDGEWPAEAVGPKIMGNPLELENRTLYFFSLIPWADQLASSVNIPQIFGRIPVDKEDLEVFLSESFSSLNHSKPMEGIVWWHFDEPVAKIKLKDFHGR